MRKFAPFWTSTMLLILLFMSADRPARAQEYPGVYADQNCLVFVQGSDDQGGLQGVVVLSYEYSMDWVITAARLGAIVDTGLLLTDGHQYVYNADGTRRSQSEFTSMDLDLPWSGLEFTVLPSYGHYLAPMVHGGLAYALAEMNSGQPSQIALAREEYENGQTLNLFEGFLYQFSAGELTAQIAFTEIAFGSQGLVRGNFPQDFPPPPADMPVPYPNYTQPAYPTPTDNNAGPTPASDQGPIDPTLPQGREIPPEEQVERPHFTLEPMQNYDVPAIARIGVVATQSGARIEGYGPVCDEFLQKSLGAIEGIEVVYIPFDSTEFGGAVIYDRAAWLCDKYGVDALLMTDLTKLEIPGAASSGHLTRTTRVQLSISTSLIEGAGGSFWWSDQVDDDRSHDTYEVQEGTDAMLRTDLNRAIDTMVSDLAAGGKLQGGHVD